jgi:hypothetical protein
MPKGGDDLVIHHERHLLSGLRQGGEGQVLQSTFSHDEKSFARDLRRGRAQAASASTARRLRNSFGPTVAHGQLLATGLSPRIERLRAVSNS